jgi:hypothetical protein
MFIVIPDLSIPQNRLCQGVFWAVLCQAHPSLSSSLNRAIVGPHSLNSLKYIYAKYHTDWMA